MKTTSRTLVGIIMAAIIVLIAVCAMPIYHVGPKGIVLPINGNKPPIKDAVMSYDMPTAPFVFQSIGTVSVEYHTDDFSEATQRLVISVAKKLAGEAGGNGLVINQLAHSAAGSAKAMQIILLRAEVISTNSN